MEDWREIFFDIVFPLLSLSLSLSLYIPPLILLLCRDQQLDAEDDDVFEAQVAAIVRSKGLGCVHFPHFNCYYTSLFLFVSSLFLSLSLSLSVFLFLFLFFYISLFHIQKQARKRANTNSQTLYTLMYYWTLCRQILQSNRRASEPTLPHLHKRATLQHAPIHQVAKTSLTG